MSKKRQKHQNRPQPSSRADQGPGDPVNVVDDIPDRSECCRPWQYLLLAVVFAAWVAFLVYCQITTAPQ